jgi:transcriptional regulator with XRE-family HTH domain
MAVRLQLPRKKAPNPTDQHVGSRVRMRRMMLAMSQVKLGDALGLTFQQVQKYEKGTNRIGASRLQQISYILQVPVTFFFEGAPTASTPHGSNGSALSMAQIDDFVSDEVIGPRSHRPAAHEGGQNHPPIRLRGEVAPRTFIPDSFPG